MKGLGGKTALVTGASSGIGQAIAVRFGAEGANVGINYLDTREGAEETERRIRGYEACAERVKEHGGEVSLLQADVSDGKDVARMVETCLEELGRIDFLVNNAGIQLSAPSEEMDIESFDAVLAVNLRGAYLCAREVIRHLLAEEKPGATVTPINQSWVEDPEKKEMVESHIPMGRAGDADEMAAATAFLCSDEAAYITGQTLFIDGGLTLYPDFRTAWSSE